MIICRRKMNEATRTPNHAPSEKTHHGEPVGRVNMKAQGRYFQMLREYHNLTIWHLIADLVEAGQEERAYRVHNNYGTF